MTSTYEGVLIRSIKHLNCQYPAPLVLVLDYNDRATLYSYDTIKRFYCKTDDCDYTFNALNIPGMTFKVINCYAYPCCSEAGPGPGPDPDPVYDPYRVMFTDSAGVPDVDDAFRFFPQTQELILADVPNITQNRSRLVLNAGGDYDITQNVDHTIVGSRNMQYSSTGPSPPTELSFALFGTDNSMRTGTTQANSVVVANRSNLSGNFINSAALLNNTSASSSNNSIVLGRDATITSTSSIVASSGPSTIGAQRSVVLQNAGSVSNVNRSVIIGTENTVSTTTTAGATLSINIAAGGSTTHSTNSNIVLATNSNVTTSYSAVIMPGTSDATGNILNPRSVSASDSVVMTAGRVARQGLSATRSVVFAVPDGKSGSFIDALTASNSFVVNMGTLFRNTVTNGIFIGDINLNTGGNNPQQDFTTKDSILLVRNHTHRDSSTFKDFLNDSIAIGVGNTTRRHRNMIVIGMKNNLIQGGTSAQSLYFDDSIVIGSNTDILTDNNNTVLSNTIIIGNKNLKNGCTNSTIVGHSNSCRHNVGQVIIGSDNTTGRTIVTIQGSSTETTSFVSNGVLVGIGNTIESASEYSTYIGRNNKLKFSGTKIDSRATPNSNVMIGDSNTIDVDNFVENERQGSRNIVLGSHNVVLNTNTATVMGCNVSVTDAYQTTVLGSNIEVGTGWDNMVICGSVTKSRTSQTLPTKDVVLASHRDPSSERAIHALGSITSSNNTTRWSRLYPHTAVFNRGTVTNITSTGAIQAMKTAQLYDTFGMTGVDPSTFGIPSADASNEDLRALVSVLLRVVKELADAS